MAWTTSRVWRRGLASALVCLPFVAFACGSPSQHTYADASVDGGGTGGSAGGTGGSAGGTAGSGGTGAAGSAGASGSSGSAGTSGTGGQAGADAGQACTADSDCDDGNPCSGVEACSGGFCKAGTPLADNAPCVVGDAGVGDAGTHTVCQAGTCVATCTQDSDCDDGDVCTGVETCSPQHICQQGTPMICDDSDTCTDNKCDPAKGCYYPLIDADKDGHAPSSLGACGDDCNDNDKTIYTGAAELCDGKDNNCNGSIDELAPRWYVDCDGDGFAAANAVSVQQCSKPTTPDASCSGASGATWTSTAPGPGVSDCWDKDSKAHPYTAATNDTAWQSTAITGAPTTVDFDYNCDGTEEPRYTSTGGNAGGTCTKLIFGNVTSCFGGSGWTSSSVPACGAKATYTYCNVKCVRTSETRTQQCR